MLGLRTTFARSLYVAFTASWQIALGRTIAYTYNGTVLGPVLRGVGDTLRITLVNNLPVAQTSLLHGISGDCSGNRRNGVRHKRHNSSEPAFAELRGPGVLCR